MTNLPHMFRKVLFENGTFSTDPKRLQMMLYNFQSAKFRFDHTFHGLIREFPKRLFQRTHSQCTRSSVWWCTAQPQPEISTEQIHFPNIMNICITRRHVFIQRKYRTHNIVIDANNCINDPFYRANASHFKHRVWKQLLLATDAQLKSIKTDSGASRFTLPVDCAERTG